MRRITSCMLEIGIVLLLSGCAGREKALVIPLTPSQQQEQLHEPEEPVVEQQLSQEGTESVPIGENEEKNTQKEKTELIYVYVCGAVQHPGVVALVQGSRVADALAAAGGFTENARLDVVNLAQLVVDGQMICFPDLAEQIETTEEIPAADAGKIDINHASLQTLTTLNGIGDARARDIITYRETHGAFQNIEEIKNVPGIKDNTFEKIKENIMVR